MRKTFCRQTNRTIQSIFYVLLVNLLSINGAFADDPGSGKGPSSAPVAAISAFTGMVFGTPIAIARMSGRAMSSIYHEYDKDPVCWQFWGRPLALPVGLLEGTVKGCIVGPKNAFRFSKEKPFSKDSFSLEDLD